MALSNEEVVRVAQLASLSLTDEEIRAFQGQLSSILELVAKLQHLDVDALPPTAHAVSDGSTPLRPDVALPSLPVEDALANAPAAEGQSFLVPRIIE